MASETSAECFAIASTTAASPASIASVWRSIADTSSSVVSLVVMVVLSVIREIAASMELHFSVVVSGVESSDLESFC
jgi:hypothetical protein